MNKKHQIKFEFLSLCNDILDENLDLENWRLIESSDQFQTDNYCGGFDAIENEFTFSYYDEEKKEYWFQLSLEDVQKVRDGEIVEVELILH